MVNKARKESLMTETNNLKKNLRWQRCCSGEHIYFDEHKHRAQFCCHPDYVRAEGMNQPQEGAINPEQQFGLWSWWEKK